MIYGIFKDLSNEYYHKEPAISRSGIMMFHESPYKYWANYINTNRPTKESTPAMDFGSAFHTYILEPHLFNNTYVEEVPRLLLKDVGRERYEEYKKHLIKLEESGKIILSEDDMLILKSMSNSLKNHDDAWGLIKGGDYENSFFWRDATTDLPLKCRPDILHPNVIVDLKTCASASYKAYQNSMITGGYHVQGAMIREGVRVLTGNDIPNVINICIEKTYPYEIGIKIISEQALDAGYKIFRKCLLDLKHAIVNNRWESYQPESVDLPGWAV